ncbi:hypothetical protein RUND412_004996 [Rhizina undulata]
MDPTGLATEIAGLAGLFSTCLQVLDIISETRDYGETSQKLALQIDVQYIRFSVWGESVGLWNPKSSAFHNAKLERPATRQAVRGRLALLKIYLNPEKMKEKYGIQCPLPAADETTMITGTDIDSHVENILSRSHPRRNQAFVGRRKALWAMSRKKKLKMFVEDLKEVNDNLYILVPVSGHSLENMVVSKRDRMEKLFSRKVPSAQVSGVNKNSVAPSILSTGSSISYHATCGWISSFVRSITKKRSVDIASTMVDKARSQTSEVLEITPVKTDATLSKNLAPRNPLQPQFPKRQAKPNMGFKRWHNLTDACGGQGRLEEAAMLSKDVLGSRIRVLGGDHTILFSTMERLAYMHRKKGEMEEAVTLYQDVIDRRRRGRVGDRKETLGTMHALAYTYWLYGRLEKAEGLYKDVIDGRRRVLGRNHKATLSAMHELADMYREYGRLDKAAVLYKELIDTRRRVLGGNHKDTLSTMQNLADMYRLYSQLEEALALYKDIIDGRRRVLGKYHKDTLSAMHHLAATYQRQGRLEEATVLFKDVIERQSRVLGRGHEDTRSTMQNLADMYQAQGRLEEAGKLYKDVKENMLRQKGRRRTT